MLVDSGSREQHLDSELMPGRQNEINDYQELEDTHKIVPVGHDTLEGIGMGHSKVPSPTRTANKVR